MQKNARFYDYLNLCLPGVPPILGEKDWADKKLTLARSQLINFKLNAKTWVILGAKLKFYEIPLWGILFPFLGEEGGLTTFFPSHVLLSSYS